MVVETHRRSSSKFHPTVAMVEGIGVVQQVLRWFTIDSEPLQHRIQAKLIKIVFYKISLMEIQTKAVPKAMDDIRKKVNDFREFISMDSNQLSMGIKSIVGQTSLPKGFKANITGRNQLDP